MQVDSNDPLLIPITIGLAVVINIVWRLIERYALGRLSRRDHTEWVEDVRRVLYQLCNVEVERAELILTLAEHMRRCPKGFEGVAQASLARSLILVPAAAQAAEEMGLFPPGTFASMRVIPGASTVTHASEGSTGSLDAASTHIVEGFDPAADKNFTVVGTQVVPLPLKEAV